MLAVAAVLAFPPFQLGAHKSSKEREESAARVARPTLALSSPPLEKERKYTQKEERDLPREKATEENRGGLSILLLTTLAEGEMLHVLQTS